MVQHETVFVQHFSFSWHQFLIMTQPLIMLFRVLLDQFVTGDNLARDSYSCIPRNFPAINNQLVITDIMRQNRILERIVREHTDENLEEFVDQPR